MYDDLVPLTGKCSVCGVESTSRCAGCYAAFYCGADHQKQDWRGNDHKARCARPYRIEKTADLGREVFSAMANLTCSYNVFIRSVPQCLFRLFRIPYDYELSQRKKEKMYRERH